MAGSSKAVPFRRSWFLGLSLLTLILVLAVGAVLWQAVEVASLASISTERGSANTRFGCLY
jgi:CHASE3 domain sensor protein